MSRTDTMQAWVFRSKGQPSQVLRLEPAFDRPAAHRDYVVVKVSAVSLNPIGWKLMSQPPISWLQKTPSVPECDLSGTIVEGDLARTDLNVGDAVFGIKKAEDVMKTGQGVLAEYALVDKHLLRRKPDDVEFDRAAALPLATLTALGALVDQAGLTRQSATGKKVLINGGSGGVGIFAVQIASAYGCQVSTTCSSGSRALVESLASDVKIFDYTARPLSAQLTDYVNEDKKPFDVIFDTVGVPDLYHHSPSYLSAKGVYIDIAGPHLDGSISSLVRAGAYLVSSLFRPSWLGGVNRKYKFFSMSPSEANMNEMERLVKNGSIKPIVDETFEFENAKKAYERSMSGRAKGKVVIRVA